jgi:hypothetical protein
MLKGIENLFECHSAFGAAIDSLPDVSVGSAAHFLYQLKALQYMFLNLFAHFLFYNLFFFNVKTFYRLIQ